MSEIIITAHAVIRYLERGLGLSAIEDLRLEWWSEADKRDPRPIIHDLPETDFLAFLEREGWVNRPMMEGFIRKAVERLRAGEVLPFGVVLACNRVITVLDSSMRPKKTKEAREGYTVLLNKAPEPMLMEGCE